ncbi:restriction endonuclease [Pectobacterium sp. B2J-2]|uniref:restriction endonuclease n=1 Tax=Pectobacterium sp. B2J-2 TaxID=3385372 RepID=UPI0038FCEBD4
MIGNKYLIAELWLKSAHTPVLIVLWGVMLLILIVILPFCCKRKSARQRRHQRYLAQAVRILALLPKINGKGKQLSYLRKINPYVFEELVLLALEHQGFKVVRNASYSGDGGLDGQVIIDGRRWLIQAKRYSRAIDPAHVEAFSALLIQHQCGGLFIHTGRTGTKSRQRENTRNNDSFPLYIISGQRLLFLLTDELAWSKLIGAIYED